jgi:hypothetical protein
VFCFPGAVPQRGRGEAGQDGRVKSCDFCGRQEADDAKTLTWSTAVENGRPKTYCDTCSREHLRAMEGKLDSEYW